MKTLVAIMFLSLLVGCASVKHIGEINDYKVYEASTTDAFAPNTTTVLMARDGGKPEVINKARGSSVVGTIAAPVSSIASSVIQARAIEEAASRLRPDETNIENHGSKAASGSVSQSDGGNAYSNSSSYSHSNSSSNANSNSSAITSNTNVNNNDNTNNNDSGGLW